MRTLKLHFATDALPTLNTFLKETKEARIFRRAQAVRDVVKGQRLQTVSDTLHFTYSALRKWVYRFASQGTQGLVDRPRPGRPRKVTCELEQYLHRLVDQDPLEQGARSSQWNCRELAMVLAQQTGVQLGRESVRGVLKKRREAPTAPPGVLIPPRLSSPTALLHSPLSSTKHVVARSFCSMQTKRSSGALRCPARAGGAKPSGLASPSAR